MTEPVTADATLQAKLATANGHPVALCDSSGTVIGVALTLEQIQRYEVELAKQRVSAAELDRRAAVPATKTMDDVLRLLEQQ